MKSPTRSLVLLTVLLTVLLAGLAVAGCRNTVITIPVPTAPTQVVVAPTPTPTPVVKNTIQFRVVGNANSVRVRYATPVDGISQLVTTLPYISTSFSTAVTSMFLSLEATPVSYPYLGFPFLSVQIVVNDAVFRESASQDALLNTLAISGTWRQ